jgi:hypothetical protein
LQGKACLSCIYVNLLVPNGHSISNDVIQNTAAQKVEESKEKTYTELSNTLSKVSSPAAEAVAPTLTEIMKSHSIAKDRVARDMEAVAQVWEDIFLGFMSRISEGIDVRLRGALVALKNEKDNALTSPGSNKRLGKSNSFGNEEEPQFIQVASSSACSGFEGGELRHSKRRRLSSIPSEEGAVDPPSGNVGPIEANMSHSIRTILEVMKQKIDTQAHTLDALSRENNQVVCGLSILQNGIAHVNYSSRTYFSSRLHPVCVHHFPVPPRIKKCQAI